MFILIFVYHSFNIWLYLCPIENYRECLRFNTLSTAIKSFAIKYFDTFSLGYFIFSENTEPMFSPSSSLSTFSEISSIILIHVLFFFWVVVIQSSTLWLHGLQHTNFPCPSLNSWSLIKLMSFLWVNFLSILGYIYTQHFFFNLQHHV